MLKLNLPQEPYWLVLENGVEVQVRPLTTAVMNMAHAKASRSIIELRQRAAIGEIGLPDLDDEETRQAYIEAALSEHLALASIVDWKGVQNPEGTEPAKVTPETIRGLMAIYFISQKFLQKYLGSLDELAAEGNASRLAVSGISAAGQPTATDATPSSSPAAKKKRTRQGYGFRFKDWADYTATAQTIGTGNGTQTAFQLTKLYVSGSYTYTREIKKPVNGTVKIYKNSILQGSGFTIDYTTGIVTFTVAPTAGQVISADFEFDVPVRFDTDQIDVRADGPNFFTWDSVPVVEIRV